MNNLSPGFLGFVGRGGLQRLALLVALPLASDAAGQTLVGTQWDGDYVRYDLATQTLLHEGPSGLQNLQGSAMFTDGRWWVAASLGRFLVELNPLTGALGQMRSISNESRGFAANPITGELYGIDWNANLYKWNPTTDAFTVLGSVGSPGQFQGLAFTQDGRLFAWCVNLDPARNGLWEIDPYLAVTLRHVPDPSGALYQHQFLTTNVDGSLLGGRSELWRIDPDTGAATFIVDLGVELSGADILEVRDLGLSFCAPQPNSLGRPARIVVYGSELVVDNHVRLGCRDLPFYTSGYFLMSRSSGYVPNAGGSAGTLCLGGAIGRLSQQVTNSGALGWVSVGFDVTQVPTPTGLTSVAAGTTWYFTFWYRDTWPTVTSNFSDGYNVVFQ